MKLLLFNFQTNEDDDVFGFTADWIRAFAERFEQVFVITSHLGPASLPSNVEIFSLGAEKGHGLFKKLQTFSSILWSLRKEPLDLVFFHMTLHFVLLSWPFLWIRQLWWRQHIPKILWYAHRSVHPFLLPATWLVDRVVTTSEQGFPIRTSKKHCIGHGLSSERFHKHIKPDFTAPPAPFTLLSLARLSPIKQLEYLIRATALLKESSHAVHLLLAGQEPGERQEYTKRLHREIHDLGIQNEVEFLGPISYSKVPEILSKADLTINISLTGSLDKAVLESLMAGVPVLALRTAYQTVFSGLDFEEDCLLNSQDPEEIANKIQVWIELPPEERHRRKSALSQLAHEKFGLQSLVEKVLSLQKEVLR